MFYVMPRLLMRSQAIASQAIANQARQVWNLWIDEYRARKIRRSDVDATELLDEQAIDGEKIICDHITLHQVNDAMDQLPDDQRSILALIAVQGMSYKEVAETLSIPMGTVMSRLARARIALSQYLKTTALEMSQ